MRVEIATKKQDEKRDKLLAVWGADAELAIGHADNWDEAYDRHLAHRRELTAHKHSGPPMHRRLRWRLGYWLERNFKAWRGVKSES